MAYYDFLCISLLITGTIQTLSSSVLYRVLPFRSQLLPTKHDLPFRSYEPPHMICIGERFNVVVYEFDSYGFDSHAA